jgi:transposase
MAKTSLVNKYCFISNPIKNVVSYELSETQSMKTIAKRVSVSSSTVIRLLESTGETLEPSRFELPEHLSFDEFKSVKEAAGSMSFIFTNSQTHDIIDIVENRQQKELIAYFEAAEKVTKNLNLKIRKILSPTFVGETIDNKHSSHHFIS